MKLHVLLGSCNPTKLVYFPLFPKPLMLFSPFAPGGSHTRAGDRCGRAAGHAQWCRARSQSQGRTKFCQTKSGGNIMVFIQTVVLFFLQDLLVDCFKPTEVSPFPQAFPLLFLSLLYLLFLTSCVWPFQDFISELLDKIRGMQKLSTPQKKWWRPSPPSASALASRLPSTLSISPLPFLLDAWIKPHKLLFNFPPFFVTLRCFFLLKFTSFKTISKE